jgi:hypothetical protein
VKIPANSLCAVAIALVALLGVAPLAAVADPSNTQLAQAAYTPPTQAQFDKALDAYFARPADPAVLDNLIKGMIANDPNAAADIQALTVAAAKEEQALGGGHDRHDVVDLTLAVIAAVDANINPAAGPGTLGSPGWAATLVANIITGVQGATGVAVNGNGNLNHYVQYTQGFVTLPPPNQPASPH